MRKINLYIGLALMFVCVTLSGCGTNNKEKDKNKEGEVVTIYCWNTEFKEDLYEKYAKDIGKKHGVEIDFVVIPDKYGAYQTNLDEALANYDKAIADDKVDIFLAEADYVSKYVEGEYALDIVKEVGLTEKDLSQQYEYTKEMVTKDGVLKGVSWQATPGIFAYRRSIAKEVLGTDDPVQVQKKLSSWDDFDKVAEKMKKKGYKILSGYEDSFRPFSNNISKPWVEGNKINIDDNVLKWVEQTKKYTDKGYNNKTTLWTPQWGIDQGPKGKVFGFFYSTWGINFTLLENALEDPDAEAKVGNGIFGDYAVCAGPEPYYWGGTWILAAKGTDNKSFIRDLMYRLTCDKETMKKITLESLDFTNNQAAIEEIANSDYKAEFLGGQNHIKLFAENAKKIDMSNVTKYDYDLTEEYKKVMHDYFSGKCSYDKALDKFYKSIQKKYPELSR